MGQMASALAHVSWENCLIDPHRDRVLESYARRKMGVPLTALRYFTQVPWLARAFIDLHPEVGLLKHLDLHQSDILTLVISQENSCRFCYAAVRMVLWAQGMSEARIQRIEQALSSSEFGPKMAAAIAFGRSQSRVGPRGASEARRLLCEAGFNADKMKEVAFVVGSTDFYNRLSTIPAIPAHTLERMPDQVLVRLLRPLIGRVLEKRRGRGRPAPLGRPPCDPYAGLIRAYEGSPIAAVLGRTIEEMWDSSVLTRRGKLLMLAVVARGLGCEVCAIEIGEVLQREGLDESALGQVLTHLDAPELDDTERTLVRFARETIWYEPASLQRRARAVRDSLSGPQLIEAIGVASLANGLCRMGAMVMDHS
jgi:alkylhydroperoxidase family enzyme